MNRPSAPDDASARAAPRLTGALQRPLVAGLVLLAVYAALSFLMDPGGYLGTDTGAKVATLDHMDQEGTARPVLGYWAEQYDPDGELHPIFDARPIDDDWVHVTTLPMLEVARPLYALGGYRLTLLLPMLGAVGAAFAARSLAQRSSGDDAGWFAYWVVGLLSPIVIYALDFWEHAPGVACIVGSVALLAGVVDGAPVRARAIGAGALLGLAATMRNESFVYAVVAVGCAALVLLIRDRSVKRSVATGAWAVVGFAGPWLANRALEAWLGGNSRTARVGAATSGGLDRSADRWREAVVTTLSLRSIDLGEVVLVGGLFVGVVALAVVFARGRRAQLVLPLLALAALLQVAQVARGLGFIPGLFAAAPIAVAGVLGPPRAEGAAGYARVVALAAIPVVWMFQLVGGAGPQWAGRYILPSCILLVSLGAAGLVRAEPRLRAGLLALSVLVTGSGIAWMSYRTHEVEAMFDTLVERPEDVIISRNGFLLREGGAIYEQRLWLTAVSDEDLDRAVEVVRESGHESFGVLDGQPDAQSIDRADLMSTDHLSVVGEDFYLHSYEVSAGP